MNFIEAVEAMKEGKKIRRKSWNKGHYWKLIPDETKIINNQDNVIEDWEIYEEDNWSLAKEIHTFDSGMVTIEDIKMFIQKVKEDFKKLANDEGLKGVLENYEDVIDKRTGKL